MKRIDSTIEKESLGVSDSIDIFIKPIRDTKDEDSFHEFIDVRENLQTSYLNTDIEGAISSVRHIKPGLLDLDNEGTILLNEWILINIFAARITELNTNSVILEVIINDDEIEEQEYGMKFFEGFDLKKIKYFKIKCYERAREQRVVMTDASNSLKRDDFPIIDIIQFKKCDLFD